MDLRRKTWTPTQPLQVDFWDEGGSTTPFECKMMTIFIAFIIIITRLMVDHLSKRTPAHLPLILRHRVLADVGASPSYLRICIQFFRLITWSSYAGWSIYLALPFPVMKKKIECSQLQMQVHEIFYLRLVKHHFQLRGLSRSKTISNIKGMHIDS